LRVNPLGAPEKTKIKQAVAEDGRPVLRDNPVGAPEKKKTKRAVALDRNLHLL